MARIVACGSARKTPYSPRHYFSTVFTWYVTFRLFERVFPVLRALIRHESYSCFRIQFKLQAKGGVTVKGFVGTVSTQYDTYDGGQFADPDTFRDHFYNWCVVKSVYCSTFRVAYMVCTGALTSCPKGKCIHAVLDANLPQKCSVVTVSAVDLSPLTFHTM